MDSSVTDPLPIDNSDSENQPPTAVIESDITVIVGDPIFFDASSSFDPDGSITDFIWDFGDGNTSTLITVEHRYDQLGEFSVTLTVVDDSGAKDAVSLTITVTPVDSDKVTLEVRTNPAGAGTITLDPSGGLYEVGTTVNIQAVPNTGYEFVRYTGDIESSQSVLDFIVLENSVIVAEFVIKTVTVTVSIDVEPAGAGIITLEPPGGSYPAGTEVTLTAIPSKGYEFVEYSGDISEQSLVTTITIESSISIQATFEWSPAMGNPGNLLVTGFQGDNVTEYDRFDGTRLGEIVPKGSGGLSFASGIDFGTDGDMYIVSVDFLGDTTILQYDGSTGNFVGEVVTGLNSFVFFTLTFGPNGNLYFPVTLDFLDVSENSILEYDINSGELGTFVAPEIDGLDKPLGLTFGTHNNLFVVGQDSNNILEYDGTSGEFLNVFADFDSIGVANPVDLTFGPSDDLFVTISSNESVARIDGVTGMIETFVSPGSGGLSKPAGILFHPDNGNLLVVSQETDSVLEYDGTTGEFLGVFVAAIDGDGPFFMAFRP